MNDFKTRLIAEKDELLERLGKLEDFLGSDKLASIDEVQQDLLPIQAQAMRTYLSCLNARLEKL